LSPKPEYQNNERGRRRRQLVFDFTNKMNMQKQIVGTNFVVEDSIPIYSGRLQMNTEKLLATIAEKSW
jgi:hypothetical protein